MLSPNPTKNEKLRTSKNMDYITLPLLVHKLHTIVHSPFLNNTFITLYAFLMCLWGIKKHL